MSKRLLKPTEDPLWLKLLLGAASLAFIAVLLLLPLALVFKDQRELSAEEVAKFAELLGETAAEVASRAGVSTPAPGQGEALAQRVAALERRIAELEAEVAALKVR